MDADEMQRRLEALFRQIEDGRIVFDQDRVPQTIRAVEAVRRGPDGIFDLDTVTGLVRALLFAIDVEPDDEVPEGAVSETLPPLELPGLDQIGPEEEDYIGLLVDAANTARRYLALTAAVVPRTPIEPIEASVLMGHIVRVFKLYDSAVFLLVNDRMEIASIVLRTLVDTAINLEWLLAKQAPAVTNYLKGSLAYDKGLWDEIEKRKKDPPLPIEERMQRSILRSFARAGFQLEEVTWKDRRLLGDAYRRAIQLGMEPQYQFVFRTASHSVHGTWQDLLFNQLEERPDGGFSPSLGYGGARPQLLEAATRLALDAAAAYAERILGPRAEALTSGLAEIADWFAEAQRRHWEAIGELG